MSETFKCELCNKEYKRKASFLKHKCKFKERIDNKNTAAFRFAYLAFLTFNTYMFPRSKPKSEIEFIKSSYYDNFIKYGEFMTIVKINSLEKYTRFLLDNNVPITAWCDDVVYNTYITNIIRKEKPVEAVERTILVMERWAKDNEQPITEYFSGEKPSTILTNIHRGKLSPWVLYNTKSGKNFLRRLNSIHMDKLYEIIDPEFWKTEFTKHEKETFAIKSVLKTVGL